MPTNKRSRSDKPKNKESRGATRLSEKCKKHSSSQPKRNSQEQHSQCSGRRRKSMSEPAIRLFDGDWADTAERQRVHNLIQKRLPSFDEAAPVVFVAALLEKEEATFGEVYRWVSLPAGEDGRRPSSQAVRSLKSMGLIQKTGWTTSAVPSCNKGGVNSWRLADRKLAASWLREQAPWLFTAPTRRSGK